MPDGDIDLWQDGDDDVTIREHADGSITVAWPGRDGVVFLSPGARTMFPTFRDLRETIERQVGILPSEAEDIDNG